MGNPQSAIRGENRRLVLTSCLATCVGLIAVQPLWSWGASLQEKIEKEKQNLQQLKQEIRKTDQEIRKTREQKDRLRKKAEAGLQEIERLDRQEHEEQREADSIKREIKRIDRELKKTKDQVNKLRSEIKDKKAIIGDRLKSLYIKGRAGWVSPLITAGSYVQFERRLRYLSSLATWERGLFDEYRRQVAQSERLQDEQENAREELVTRNDQIDKKLSEIRKIRSEKLDVLASLKKKTESEEHRLLILKQREIRQKTLLETLPQKSKKRTTDTFQKGALLRPADGALVGRFGWQKHPTLDTYVWKKGIEIDTKEGSDIRAVSGGDVVYADWLRGYGLVVILDHGNNYFTFYAHASKLDVKEGETVAKGVVLGKTGSSGFTGFTNRNILYFELRKGTSPENPLPWLVQR